MYSGITVMPTNCGPVFPNSGTAELAADPMNVRLVMRTSLPRPNRQPSVRGWVINLRYRMAGNAAPLMHSYCRIAIKPLPVARFGYFLAAFSAAPIVARGSIKVSGASSSGTAP